MRRAVSTGLGAVTPVGNDVPTTWANLVAGVSGVDVISNFDASAYPVVWTAYTVPPASMSTMSPRCIFSALDIRVDDHPDPLRELDRLERVSNEEWGRYRPFVPTRSDPVGVTDHAVIDAAVGTPVQEV